VRQFQAQILSADRRKAHRRIHTAQPGIVLLPNAAVVPEDQDAAITFGEFAFFRFGVRHRTWVARFRCRSPGGTTLGRVIRALKFAVRYRRNAACPALVGIGRQQVNTRGVSDSNCCTAVPSTASKLVRERETRQGGAQPVIRLPTNSNRKWPQSRGHVRPVDQLRSVNTSLISR